MNLIMRFTWILGLSLMLAVAACQPAPTPLALSMTEAPPPTEAPVGPGQAAAAEIPFGQGTLFALLNESSDEHMLMPIDPATGALVPGFDPISMGSTYNYELTPDGRTLMFISYPVDTSEFPRLRFLDLETWSENPGLVLPTRGWTSASAVSVDSTRLAFATVDNRDRQVWLVDTEKHFLLESIETPLYITAIEFTSDGSGLMLYGNPENFNTGATDGPPLAEFRSAADLDLIWSRPLDAVVDGFQPNENFKGEPHDPGSGSTYRPAVAFDAERHIMYVVHADVDKLTRIEFERKRVLTRDIQPKTTLLERMLALGASVVHAKVMDGIDREARLSPDGGTLYIAGIQNKMTQATNGEWQFEQIALPLQAIDPSTATEVYTSEAAGQSLQFSPELGSIYVIFSDAAAEETHTYEVNLVDGAILNESDGVELRLSRRMDGTPLLVSTSFGPTGRNTLHAWTLDGVPLGEWKTTSFGNWLIIP